jgi:probable HAF family extracellular repeat protein
LGEGCLLALKQRIKIMYSLSLIGGLGVDGVRGRGIPADRFPGVFDLNESGEVVGRFLGSFGDQRFLQAFSTSGSSNLGGQDSQAFGINDRNEVVGQSSGFDAGFRTVPDGQISDASTIDGTFIGFEINNNGDVVGLNNQNQAFRKFENQAIENLGTLRQDGTGFSVAYDINRSGVTVGRAVTDENRQHAFRYGRAGFDSRMIDLGTLGGNNSLARDINDFNLIVGDSEITPDSPTRHAFVTVSTLSPSADLGTLATDDSRANSRAFDINNKLQIVGESDTDISGEKHAFLQDISGGMIDLNDLVPQSDQFAFDLTSATAINDAGVIVGSAKLNVDQRIRFETGRVIDGRAGDVFAFRLTPTVTRLEAEDLTLDTYRIERNNAASANQVISLRDASGTTGITSTQFKGVSGLYDVVVTYLDETDGQASLDLKLNDRSLSRWTLDRDLGSGDPIEQTFTKRVIEGVRLFSGDQLSIVGTANGGEWARVDAIELVPTIHRTQLEAEDFNLNTYLIENNDVASNGRLISLRGAAGNTGSASIQFTGRSGTYDLVVGYVDETDGTAQVNLKINDRDIDSWTLDKNLGSASPTEQTFVERSINRVFVNQGDTLSINGTRDREEWARVDYVRLVPSVEDAFRA